MTKSISELAEENDSITVEKAGFKCPQCENPESNVLLDVGDYEMNWPYCSSCESRKNHVLSGLANWGIDIT